MGVNYKDFSGWNKWEGSQTNSWQVNYIDSSGKLCQNSENFRSWEKNQIIFWILKHTVLFNLIDGAAPSV